MQQLVGNRDTLQLSGGGLKTIAFCGALDLVDLSQFKVFGGVSAGSVLALALVMGYKPSEIANLLSETNIAALIAQSVSPVGVISDGALLDQGPMIATIANWMRVKGFPADGTFKDLHLFSNGLSLRVVVCTVGLNPHLMILDEKRSPDEQVLRAIRASTAVPLVFPPVWVNGKLCIDAGTINNLSLFAADDPSRTLALLAGENHTKLAPMQSFPLGLSQFVKCGIDRLDLLVHAELLATARLARVVRMPMLPDPTYHIFRLGRGTPTDFACIIQQGRNAMIAAACAAYLASTLCFSVAFDRVLATIAWRPADVWTLEVVREYLRRRQDNGDGRVQCLDPICEDITHYKRCGIGVCYEFRCLLKSRCMGGPAVPFWIPFADIDDLEQGRQMLREEKGWKIEDHMFEYSDGEEVWQNGYDSQDEFIVARRRRRGSVHEITKAQRRSRKEK